MARDGAFGQCFGGEVYRKVTYMIIEFAYMKSVR